MTHTEEPLTIDVCVDCASMLSSAEVFDSGGEDITFGHGQKMGALWNSTRLTLGSVNNVDDEDGDGGKPWFSTHPCKGCGSTLGGDRTYATAWLKPNDRAAS